MKDKVFFDSNIILYLFMNQHDHKTMISSNLIEKGGLISYQVINEVIYNLIKKASYNEDEVEATINLMFDCFNIVDFAKNQIQLILKICILDWTLWVLRL